MNIERMKILREAVRTKGERFDMAIGITTKLKNGVKEGDRVPISEIGSCGTTACIAGWAVLLFNPSISLPISHVNKFREECSVPWNTVEAKAEELLELTPSQVGRLFYVPNWPERWRIKYLSSSAGEAARVAAKYITWFIKNNRGQ